MKTADKYQVFTFTAEERLSWKEVNGEEKIILKEPYNDEELFTPIIFSCSNSNANAALIALGEELDLMIHAPLDPSGRNIQNLYNIIKENNINKRENNCQKMAYDCL